MTRRSRPEGRPPQILDANRTIKNKVSTELVAEAALRVEAIAANSSAALLGELDCEAVLAGNVGLADRAALFLRAAS